MKKHSLHTPEERLCALALLYAQRENYAPESDGAGRAAAHVIDQALDTLDHEWPQGLAVEQYVTAVQWLAATQPMLARCLAFCGLSEYPDASELQLASLPLDAQAVLHPAVERNIRDIRKSIFDGHLAALSSDTTLPKARKQAVFEQCAHMAEEQGEQAHALARAIRVLAAGQTERARLAYGIAYNAFGAAQSIAEAPDHQQELSRACDRMMSKLDPLPFSACERIWRSG